MKYLQLANANFKMYTVVKLHWMLICKCFLKQCLQQTVCYFKLFTQ